MHCTISQTPIGRTPGDLSNSMSQHPKNGERISGEMNVVHSRLANKAIAPQSSSEAARKEVHSLRHPRASIPDGPVALSHCTESSSRNHWTTDLDGFSLANHRQFAKLPPHQTTLRLHQTQLAIVVTHWQTVHQCNFAGSWTLLSLGFIIYYFYTLHYWSVSITSMHAYIDCWCLHWLAS